MFQHCVSCFCAVFIIVHHCFTACYDLLFVLLYLTLEPRTTMQKPTGNQHFPCMQCTFVCKIHMGYPYPFPYSLVVSPSLPKNKSGIFFNLLYGLWNLVEKLTWLSDIHGLWVFRGDKTASYTVSWGGFSWSGNLLPQEGRPLGRNAATFRRLLMCYWDIAHTEIGR